MLTGSMVTGTMAGGDSVVRIVTDPTRASFEKNNKNVYGFKKEKELYSNPEDYPEVQEYMGWRLKRNKKRLARLDGASRIIQGAYRAHLAWLTPLYPNAPLPSASFYVVF